MRRTVQPTRTRPTDDGLPLLGGVDAGGTTFVCGIGRADGSVLASRTIPTASPERTLGEVVDFFAEAAARGLGVAAVGLSAFGPLERDPASANFGHVLATPKPGWSGADLVTALRQRLDVPVAVETDVNGAALAEGRYGAARGLAHFAYVTVGTGIGVGMVSAGKLVAGLMHPELGHIRVPRAPDDAFAGACSFHGDCLEGLASGPALAARFGSPAESLQREHLAWEIEAHYLAHLATMLILAIGPQRIIFGGGVGLREGLVEKIRVRARALLAGYAGAYDNDLAELIVRSPLAAEGVNAGVLGGIVLADSVLSVPAAEGCSPLW